MKLRKIIIAAVSAALIITGGIFAWYFGTTLSAQACIEYSKENTKRGATVFSNFGGNSIYKKSYIFWIAGDGDSTKPQEIFVFRSAFFGSSNPFNRYKFFASSTQSEAEKDDAGVGSIQLFLRNDDNEKENTYAQIYYGARAELPVFYCKCTITTIQNGKIVKEEKFDKRIRFNDEAWILELHGLGNLSDKEKKEVTELKLYDESHKLLYTY